ncbi:MAG: recombinase family protein [Clostridia bacterium]|nr:recombinase family protein [Clostridia bacterium]
MNLVGYCRLSRDDNLDNFSSIEEQKNMILEYANSQNLNVRKFYIDDNVSGYKFDRPAWNEMLEDIETGLVDTIVVKDMSRVGRNNGRTLVFLDDLKESGKNLIVLHDSGGIYNLQADQNDTIGITTWYNEKYVKDISRKVKSSMHSRQKSGRLIMGKYFGYIKDPKDKTKLIVDDEVKHIIKYIFELYIKEGFGYVQICKMLNEKGYPTPSLYYSQKFEQEGKIYKHKIQPTWCTYMIKQIIDNEIYTGTLITHKKAVQSIRGRSKLLPKEQNYRFENHHEQIISIDDFLLAKKLRDSKNKKIYNDNKNKTEYLFSGLIRCGECGSCMSGRKIKRAKNIKIVGYSCINYIKYGSSRCSCGEIHENYIKIQLVEFIKVFKQHYIDILSNILIIDEKTNNEDKYILDLIKRKNLLKNELKILINQKIKDLSKQKLIQEKQLIENVYEELEMNKKQNLINIENNILNIKKNNVKVANDSKKTVLDILNSIIDRGEIDRYLLILLVDKIYVYKDKSIEVHLRINIDKIINS